MATLVIVIALSSILFFPATSSSIFSTGLQTSGSIAKTFAARSGSAADIQAAVNQASSAGGGNVCIPAGTFNFTAPGHWYDLTSNYGIVMVPAGVNIFGSPTQRYANGSVISWGTILIESWAVPNPPSATSPCWFFFNGNGNPNKTCRFSDIKMVGNRFSNTSSTVAGPAGLIFNEIMNYRVDHCYFRDVCGGAVWAGWYAPNDGGNYSTHCCGVIDHSLFINTNGIPGPNMNQATVGYGVCLGRVHNAYWDSNTADVFGKYNNYTTIIEDCYFSKWRHCICNSEGYSCIVRFCHFDYDFGFHTIDNHGIYNVVPGRDFEVYNCSFTHCTQGYGNIAIMMRSGEGVFYNNTVDTTYSVFVMLSHDGLQIIQSLTFTPNFNGAYVATCHNIYVWSNKFASPGTMTVITQDPGYTTAGVDDFTHAPSAYTPYTYPCPLTLGS